MEITKKQYVNKSFVVENVTIQVDNDNHKQCHANCEQLKYSDDAKPICIKYWKSLTEVDMGQYYKAERCEACLTDFGVNKC